MKRLIIVLVLLSAPLLLGLLVTYDIIKIEWISFMEIQPSYNPQENPLPLPARSVPIQGAYNNPVLGPQENPYPASENSLERGKYFYDITCQPCHGASGQGNGPFSAFLQPRKPVSLVEGRPVTMSDGELFVVISNGVEGAMPDLRQNLPDEEMRWAVVNYVRSLQESGSQ
jgi:mono/diheme cytochrome c family protein